MEFESIKKIVEAEKKADNIKQAARQEAQIIMDQAENSREKNRLYFKGQLENKENELKKEQAEENAKRIAKIQAEKTEMLQKLKDTLQENVTEAVDKIFAKVIKI